MKIIMTKAFAIVNPDGIEIFVTDDEGRGFLFELPVCMTGFYTCRLRQKSLLNDTGPHPKEP
jgi:hypothetical protein